MSDLTQRVARLRVRIGFPAALLGLWLAQPTRRSLAIGAAIACIGEAIRIWAAGHLDKGREVTASGPYRFSRHPLYLGSTIIGIGFAVASAHVLTGMIVLGYLAITLTAAIRSEEAHLTEKFGAAYPAYRDGRTTAGRRPFSAARVMANREHRAVGGLLLALALLALKSL